MVQIAGYQVEHQHVEECGAECIAPSVPVDNVLGALVGFMSVLGTIGNSIAIFVIWRVLRQQKRKRTDGVVTVFLNLAICDLSVSVLSMPYTCYMLFNNREEDIFGSSQTMMNIVSCNISGFMFNIASRTSMYLIFYISLTRSLALLLPFMEKCWLRKRNNVLCIMGCWCIGLIVSVLPYVAGSKYSHVKSLAICSYRLDAIHEVHSPKDFWLLYLFLIIIPMAVPGLIIVISSLIVIVKMSLRGKSIASFRVLNKVRAVRKSRFGQKMEAKAILKERGGLSGIPSKGGALFTLCIIIVAFILCYTLFWVVSLEVFLEMIGVLPANAFYNLFGSRTDQYLGLTSSVLCLYLNSVLNPIVYYFQGSRFKSSLPCHQKIHRIKPTAETASFRRYTLYTDIVRTFDASQQTVAKIIVIGACEDEMEWEPKTFTQRLSCNLGLHSFKRRSVEKTHSVVSNLITGRAMEEIFSAVSDGPDKEQCPMDKLNFLRKLQSQDSIPQSNQAPGDKRRMLRKIQTQEHIVNIPVIEEDVSPTKSKLSRKSASFQDRSPTKPCSSEEPSFSRAACRRPGRVEACRPHVMGSIQTVKPKSLIARPFSFKAEAPRPFVLGAVQTIKSKPPQQKPSHSTPSEQIPPKETIPDLRQPSSKPLPSSLQPSSPVPDNKHETEPLPDKKSGFVRPGSCNTPHTGFVRRADPPNRPQVLESPQQGFVRPGRAADPSQPQVLGPPQKGFVRSRRSESFKAVGAPQRGFELCRPQVLGAPQQITRPGRVGSSQVIKPMRAESSRPMVLGAPQTVRRPRAQRMVVTSTLVGSEGARRGCVKQGGGPAFVVQSMG